MNATGDTNSNGRKGYPWTAGWEPVLSPEQVRRARCSDCGGPATYVFFTGSRGDGQPLDGDVGVVLGCDCTEFDCTESNHPAGSGKSCRDLGHRSGGYGPIELAELADTVEGSDWARHLASYPWWRDGGAELLQSALGGVSARTPLGELAARYGIRGGAAALRGNPLRSNEVLAQLLAGCAEDVRAYARRMAKTTRASGLDGVVVRLQMEKAVNDVVRLTAELLESDARARAEGRLG